MRDGTGVGGVQAELGSDEEQQHDDRLLEVHQIALQCFENEVEGTQTQDANNIAE